MANTRATIILRNNMNLSIYTFSLKKLSILLAVVIILCLCLVSLVHAQEINPAPGTYVYGSSSELSPYNTLGQSSSSGTLAPTGESQTLPIIFVLASLVGGLGLILVATHLLRTKQ